MYLLNEINRIVKDRQIDSIGIFVDMDGVIADYRFGEGINIKNNIPGTYLTKRPIHTTINNLEIINDELSCKMYILSSCLFEEQANEKNLWLDKYAAFFKKENRIFTISDCFESRKIDKIERIREKLESKECELAILIDDTHDILFLAQDELGSKVIPFHVITLID